MGSHVFNDMVAPRVTSLTVNKSGIIKTMSTQYERDLTSGSQPQGDTERIKRPNMAIVTDGFGYVGASIDRRYTTLVADQKFHIPLDWDSVEKAVEMERSPEELEENLFDPMAEKATAEWELRAGRFIKLNTNNVVGALGTPPTALGTVSKMRTRIIELGGWESSIRRAAFISPQIMENMITTNNQILGFFNPVKTSETAFIKGTVREYADALWYESMYLPTHTTGVITTQATGTTVSGGGQSGTSINLAGTTGDTLKAGDIITFANVNQVNPMTKQSIGRLFQAKVAADVTFVGSAATVTLQAPGIVTTGPYQNVDAGPIDTAIVLLMPGTTMVDGTAKTGTFGFEFTNEAFGFAGVKLPMPTKGSVDYTDQYTDPKTGMSFGLWRQSRFDDRSFSTRLDTWGGFVATMSDSSAVLLAS